MSIKTNPNYTVAEIPAGFDVTIPRLPKISTSVSKLGVSIPSINLPPIVTCRPDAPCAKCADEGGGCYATKGHWIYKGSRNCLWNNLYAFKQDSTLFFDVIAFQTKLFNFVRWFSSGDIVNEEFLKGMICVAKKNQNTHYLCFTKKYELVNEFLDKGGKIPKNLKIVFSAWGYFIPVNPHNLPMAYVYFNVKTGNKERQLRSKNMNSLIPKSAIPCSGSCASCQACWTLKKGQSVYFKKH